MANHKFKIGQQVTLVTSMINRSASTRYVVTKLLPERDGDFEYRIKNIDEPHERVASERQMNAYLRVP